jgi:kynureninase
MNVTFESSRSFAQQMDQQDPLAVYRHRFHLPELHGKPCIYLTGNSLGAMPKSVADYIQTELNDWAKLGVEGHFEATRPWKPYHHFLKEKAANIVGGLPSEVVVMNNLTTNLHLMMVSFYRPSGKRTKIVCEGGAFPSDQYALESQVRFHGLVPDEQIIELIPRSGEHTLRTEDILHVLDQQADEVALVMMGGVNYYTGQFFDLEKITQKAHEIGALAGFDLAHAAGNLPLNLHQWNVDFAVWCSYKYLNSGPGGTSGCFVHQRHENNPDLPRFAGWWGHKEEERFLMKKGFIPMIGADGWQLSNAQILPMAAHLASLEIFDEVGMDALRQKSLKLTGFAYYLLEKVVHEHPEAQIEIITPKNETERGCQLSLLAGPRGKELFNALHAKGVLTDWREPNVIRFAPVPLYNRFEEVYEVYEVMKSILS